MVSFRSHLYPASRNAFRITQEYAMQYYGMANIILMIAVLLRVVSGGFGMELLWPVLIGEGIAIALGNLLATARLKRSYAEIFFVEGHFSLISVHEILHGRTHEAFPMNYANPVLTHNDERLVIHFHDQVVTLFRKNWEDEDFELVCDWLFSRQL